MGKHTSHGYNGDDVVPVVHEGADPDGGSHGPDQDNLRSMTETRAEHVLEHLQISGYLAPDKVSLGWALAKSDARCIGQVLGHLELCPPLHHFTIITLHRRSPDVTSQN